MVEKEIKDPEKEKSELKTVEKEVKEDPKPEEGKK